MRYRVLLNVGTAGVRLKAQDGDGEWLWVLDKEGYPMRFESVAGAKRWVRDLPDRQEEASCGKERWVVVEEVEL